MTTDKETVVLGIVQGNLAWSHVHNGEACLAFSEWKTKKNESKNPMTDPWDEWFVYLPWKPTIHVVVNTRILCPTWMGPGSHEENLHTSWPNSWIGFFMPLSHGSGIRFPWNAHGFTTCQASTTPRWNDFFFGVNWLESWLGEAFGELKFLGGEIFIHFLHIYYDCIKLYGSKLCYMFLYSIVFYYK